MRRILLLMAILIVLGAIAVSCSGNGNGPVIPGMTDSAPNQQEMSSTNVQGGETYDGDMPNLSGVNKHPLQGLPLQVNHALWGLYEFIIDSNTNEVEIVPMRASNVHLNALKFLEPNGQYSMVQLASGLVWNATKTKLDLDIKIIHPFTGAMNLSGFDVKGILITRGTQAGFSDPDLVMSANNEMRLLNADGFTRWWNPREFPGNTIFAYRDGALGHKDSIFHFTATFNGYKYFCDSLGKDDAMDLVNPADRGVFRAGAQNVRHYTIGVSSLADLRFNYAIDASWAKPTVTPPVVPNDFPLEANQPEPWRIQINQISNSLYFDTNTGEQGGNLVLQVNIHDWQNAAPAPAGGINKIVGEWPGLFAATEANYVSNQGNYTAWQLTLTPKPGALTSTNAVDFMIWAESKDGAGYGGVLAPTEPLIIANRSTASVLSKKPNLPPVISSGVDGNASPGLAVETYSVTAIDPDSDPIQYMWTVTGTSINNDPGNGDGTIDIDWSSFGINNYVISCDVTDSINPAVPANDLNVQVGNKLPQVGLISGPLNVNAGYIAADYLVAATDPDLGQTLTYLWSMVPFGSPDNFTIADDAMLTLDFSNIDPGEYSINVRVTDGFAQVESTAIKVTHSNTPPTVGNVTGKSPVTSIDTSALYQAVWSDPDKTQTIVFLWSIVPAGTPENFNVTGNPDGSINIDWSTRPVGTWDLNVRASDGIAQVKGTKMTVSRNNILPEVGQVEGPESVKSSDTNAVYTAAIFDADPDQPLTVMWSVVPTGNSASYVLPAEANNSLIVDWSTYSDGTYDVNVRVDDGYDQVEGTLLIVMKFDNEKPTVGAVSGPTLVLHSTFNAQYTCPMNDPEGDPLTVRWSIVPFGNSPNFNIPGDEVNPLTVDWSDYVNLGDYSVNCQADDGFHPPVSGTALKVTIGNTPPTVGQVSGPTPVTCANTAAHYTAPINDIDTTQTLTVFWSVVPSGNSPNYVIPANGDNSVDINWSTYLPGTWDVNVRVSDGVALVQGTKLVVTRNNTSPTVGSVSGPTPVTCTSTASKYTAPISDCDTGQALTVLWSVVPVGNPPNYVIPASGDYSVTINWSTYAVGQYNVNVRVNDGFGNVTGTLLVVTKSNTAPVAGAVSGPATSTDQETKSYTLNPAASDCDAGQTLTFTWSVVVKGNSPNYTIPTATGNININWNNYGVGVWTVGCRVGDGITNSIATPRDVTVTLGACAGAAHSYLGTITPNKYSVAPMSILPRADIAFLPESAGFFGGLAVAQTGPHTLGVFDADNTGASTVQNTYDLGKIDAVVSMDTDPIDARILIVTGSDPDQIKILDANTIFGNPIDGVINSGHPSITYVALDVEADGDFWAVRRNATSGVQYALVHYTFLADSPYYTINPAATTNITPTVGTQSDIFDIAINQTAGRLVLFEAGANGRGSLHTYSIPGGAPATLLASQTSIFPQVIDYDSNPSGLTGYGDIEIDHVNTNSERCRILVYARLADLTSSLKRYDASYNLLDTRTYSLAWPAFSINTDSSAAKRNLIMPDTNLIRYWQTPGTW